MLPLIHRVIFLVFACACLTLGAYAFRRVLNRIRAGRADTDLRTDRILQRIWYAVVTTLTQSRTFRKRPVISFFHSLIFYGFVFYLLVNVVDAVDGFYALQLTSRSPIMATYLLVADLLSACVLIGVFTLVLRRFFLPSRRDFKFNDNTLLHEDVRASYIARDSVIVSIFIMFHVGSRAIEMGAKLAMEGSDRFQPFASLLSHLFSTGNAEAWRIFGFWGALGSVLAFLAYFPYSKHIHIFMAPAKYTVARRSSSGVLPLLDLNIENEKQTLGANKLEELAWPRLLDAYACIQCNRCQDVCPATATGKSLSPSALEINKRMELNALSRLAPDFKSGDPSPRTLLQFALTPEAAWACTTCGACMQVCPVQDEPMLDIIDIRRQQVMMEGEFPAQLQTAFRGMERAKNPWGISQDARLAWAEGLNLKTMQENPDPEVLYWVGCAATYDPQAQKTARAFVQLLQHAGVNVSVLGKQECCTGDSARRAGNEYLYRQLADENVDILNGFHPKLIVATCPHCMNAIGKEYRQLGGNFKVMHHTEYLEQLVNQGKLSPPHSSSSIAFHDPCYLGRHNDVYDAPRKLLKILSSDVRPLEREREGSFCCGAGGAQFWKEEENGSEKIADNRLREVTRVLESGSEEKILAVGCPFCKSMLKSSSVNSDGSSFVVRDIAEILWESIERMHQSDVVSSLINVDYDSASTTIEAPPVVERQPSPPVYPTPVTSQIMESTTNPGPSEVKELELGKAAASSRPKWSPSKRVNVESTKEETDSPVLPESESTLAITSPIASSQPVSTDQQVELTTRQKRVPKAEVNLPMTYVGPSPSDEAPVLREPMLPDDPLNETPATPIGRKKWTPRK